MNTRERKYHTLVHGHTPALYRYAYWLCDGDRSAAEDIVQETFLRAWKALDQLDDPGAAKAWLMTILRRENARRFERKRFDYADLEPDQLSFDADAFDQHMEREELQRGILQLPPSYRDPLLLQVLGGFSCAEIGEILELGKGAVMTRLFRARNMLARRWAPPEREKARG